MRLGLLLLLALSPFSSSDRSHVRLTLQPEGQAPTPDLVQALEDRLYRLEVDGTVEITGERIVVDMPRVRDAERVRRVLTRNLSMELRLVRFPERGGGSPSQEAVLEHFGGQLPPELELLQGLTTGKPIGKPIGKQYYAVERTPIITDLDVRTASPSVGQFNHPIVQFSLTPKAGELFGRATEANIGSAIAIVLDGEVLSAPIIQARITDEGIIEGDFTEMEVRDLALLLTTGPLPARLLVVDQQVSEAVPDRRFWVAMTALAVFFLLFCAVLVVLFRRGGQPRPI
jgi:preprotein translocase subunit SecD